MFKGFGKGGKGGKKGKLPTGRLYQSPEEDSEKPAPEEADAAPEEPEFPPTEPPADSPPPIEGGLPTPEGEFTSVAGGLPDAERPEPGVGAGPSDAELEQEPEPAEPEPIAPAAAAAAAAADAAEPATPAEPTPEPEGAPPAAAEPPVEPAAAEPPVEPAAAEASEPEPSEAPPATPVEPAFPPSEPEAVLPPAAAAAKRGRFGLKRSAAAPAAAAATTKKSRRIRISWDAWKDPSKRTRLIIWGGAGVLAIAALTIVALGVTSTYWFCAEGCHKVQDDTIIAFDGSSHAEVNCMACHMPVGANPAVFMLHKMEALGELYLTVTNQFELPLNPHNHVATEMPSDQCTQCHGPNREYTYANGILMNHDVHAEKEVDCTICHNRVAHPEDFELTLAGNTKHADWMEMTACFRCHSQEPDAEAPGACEACHPTDFDLVPAFHKEEGFFPEGHGDLAQEEATKVAEAKAEAGMSEETTGEAEAEGEGEEELPPVETINRCYTCHSQQYCVDCHGVPMPHPANFVEGHGEYGEENAQKCTVCHGDADTFCNECHHGRELDFDYTPGQPWIPQHYRAVEQNGASACFECHDPTYCARCHVRGTPE
jgi:hypothetical protein